jgi:hypothetical protein
VSFPGGAANIDPNALFPRDIAEKCWENDQPCRDVLAKKPTTETEVKKFVQTQFFLSIKDCSRGFTLPVVGLHNNVITDTPGYIKDKGKANLADISGKTFDKEAPAGGASTDPLPYSNLKAWLKKGFAAKVVEDVHAGGSTNIFRWCQLADNTRCYIGNPDRPDDVVWVTNEEDFKKLQGSKANVALQTRIAEAESAKDLSSLFVVLEELVRAKHAPNISSAEQEVSRTAEELMKVLQKLMKGGTAPLHEDLPLLEKSDALAKAVEDLETLRAAADTEAGGLHFVNIETADSPYAGSGQSRADLRVASYQAIVDTLSKLGLHCCTTDPEASEEEKAKPLKEIEDALREEEKKKPAGKK